MFRRFSLCKVKNKVRIFFPFSKEKLIFPSFLNKKKRCCLESTPLL